MCCHSRRVVLRRRRNKFSYQPAFYRVKARSELYLVKRMLAITRHMEVREANSSVRRCFNMTDVLTVNILKCLAIVYCWYYYWLCHCNPWSSVNWIFLPICQLFWYQHLLAYLSLHLYKTLSTHSKWNRAHVNYLLFCRRTCIVVKYPFDFWLFLTIFGYFL